MRLGSGRLVKMIGSGSQPHLRRASKTIVLALTVWAFFCFFRALAQKTRPPLSKNDLITLLENKVSPVRVGELAKQFGVSFELTPETQGQLRKAGATEELLKMLGELSPKPATPAPSNAAPKAPPPGPPVLIVETTPQGAEIYVDDERVGTTGPEGKLKISSLSPGEHHLRVSQAGYRDYAGKVELTAGQNSAVAVALEASKPAAPQPQPSAPSNPAQLVGANDQSLVNKLLSGAFGGLQAGDATHKVFYVQHQHGSGRMGPFRPGAGMQYCMGTLVVGEGKVRYNTDKESDAFDVAAAEINDIQFKGNHVHFRIKDKKYHFIVREMGAMGQFQSPDELRRALEGAAAKK